MLLAKLFGTKSGREIKKLVPIVTEINQFYDSLASRSDDELKKRTYELREQVIQARKQADETLSQSMDKGERHKLLLKAEQDELDANMVEAFAMVKETCRRMMGQSWMISGQETKWEMIPYDVQLLGAIILHKGKVAEMKTGEGKTLVATMPLYLNALSGRGVHVVTVNDYLAQRDAEWMEKYIGAWV